jgi:hypothetical protein
MNDLRVPSGVFFVLLGIILCSMGVIYPQFRAPLTGANVNLFAGMAMFIFGGALLWLARRPS